MSRSSVVVIASTVVVLLGSVVCLAFSALEIALPFLQPDMVQKTPMMRGAFFFAGAWFFALAAWGISTAIGLMRRSRWARFSMIVFGVLLLLFSAFMAVVMLVIPLPADPRAPQAVQIARTVFVIFYGLLALLGLSWAYAFNTAALKLHFAQPGLPAQESPRPLSVMLIAWWMLLGVAMFPFLLWMRFPVVMFGVVLTGWAAATIYALFAGAQIYLGLGLLRLNPLSRVLTIAWFVFGAVNGAINIMVPGTMQRMYAAMPRWMLQNAAPADVPRSFALLMAVAMAIPVWFLVTRRSAFLQQ